jgi:hypothetical protein
MRLRLDVAKLSDAAAAAAAKRMQRSGSVNTRARD